MKKISFKTDDNEEFSMTLDGDAVTFKIGYCEAGPFDGDYLNDIKDCMEQMLENIENRKKKVAQERIPSSSVLT